MPPPLTPDPITRHDVAPKRRNVMDQDPRPRTAPGTAAAFSPVILTGTALVAGRWWQATGGPAGHDTLWLGLGIIGAFGAGITLAVKRAPKTAAVALGASAGLAYTAVCGFSRSLPPVLLVAVPVVAFGYWVLGRLARGERAVRLEHRNALELSGQRFDHEERIEAMRCGRDLGVTQMTTSAQVQIAQADAVRAAAVAMIAGDRRGNPLLAHSAQLRATLPFAPRWALPDSAARVAGGVDEVFDQEAA
jgi:hypothetical protein